MAKYDWIALEEEYILSDYKSVSAFLKDKGINNNGTTRKRTSGWKDKKRQKEDKKATKTIENDSIVIDSLNLSTNEKDGYP